eukprot:10824063-Heterocapsa_arctica.AAC.1
MASEQHKQHLINKIAMNTGIDASSLRTEFDSQNRHYSVKSMLGSASPTTEHYDMFVADNEEEERQDRIDRIEREKETNAYAGLFQEGHAHLSERSPVSD